MPCSSPAPQIENGYLVGVEKDKLQYMCNGGYSMVGSSFLYCGSGGVSGDVRCQLAFLDDVWFWLLIGFGGLLALAAVTGICICCIRYYYRKRSRRKVNNSNDRNRRGEETPTCCEAGGPCYCVDYYGCCSLLGCCGYHGCCACCCICVRCCREPEQGSGISGLPLSIFRKKTRKKKAVKFGMTSPIIIIQKDKSKSVISKTRAKVPVIPIWLPHSKPVRNINSSTR